MPHDLKQLLKGTLAGGLAIFLVHGIGWGALPLTNQAIHDLNAPEVLAALNASASVRPGTYFINANASRTDTAVPDSVQGWMTVHAPEDDSDTRALGLSALINLASALLASWLVLRGRGTTFGARFQVGLAVGAFGVLAGPVWDWAWGWYSLAYAAAVGLNVVVGFVAMAALVAWLVRPANPVARGA